MNSPGSPGNNLLNIYRYLLGERNCLLLRSFGVAVADGRDNTHHCRISPIEAERVVHHVEPAPIFAGHYASVRLVPVKNDLLVQVFADGVEIYGDLSAVV